MKVIIVKNNKDMIRWLSRGGVILNIEYRDFKIGLFEEFWDRRNQELVPASDNEMRIKKQKFLIFYNLIAQLSQSENYPNYTKVYLPKLSCES